MAAYTAGLLNVQNLTAAGASASLTATNVTATTLNTINMNATNFSFTNLDLSGSLLVRGKTTVNNIDVSGALVAKSTVGVTGNVTVGVVDSTNDTLNTGNLVVAGDIKNKCIDQLYEQAQYTEDMAHTTRVRQMVEKTIKDVQTDGQTYDFIVVGSGSSGGMAAYTLAIECPLKNKNVLLIEKGKPRSPNLYHEYPHPILTNKLYGKHNKEILIFYPRKNRDIEMFACEPPTCNWFGEMFPLNKDTDGNSVGSRKYNFRRAIWVPSVFGGGSTVNGGVLNSAPDWQLEDYMPTVNRKAFSQCGEWVHDKLAYNGNLYKLLAYEYWCDYCRSAYGSTPADVYGLYKDTSGNIVQATKDASGNYVAGAGKDASGNNVSVAAFCNTFGTPITLTGSKIASDQFEYNIEPNDLQMKNLSGFSFPKAGGHRPMTTITCQLSSIYRKRHGVAYMIETFQGTSLSLLLETRVEKLLFDTSGFSKDSNGGYSTVVPDLSNDVGHIPAPSVSGTLPVATGVHVRDMSDDSTRMQEYDIMLKPGGTIFVNGNTLNSPMLLLRSGIGAYSEAEFIKRGIQKVSHNPGVGVNYGSPGIVPGASTFAPLLNLNKDKNGNLRTENKQYFSDDMFVNSRGGLGFGLTFYNNYNTMFDDHPDTYDNSGKLVCVRSYAADKVTPVIGRIQTTGSVWDSSSKLWSAGVPFRDESGNVVYLADLPIDTPSIKYYYWGYRADGSDIKRSTFIGGYNLRNANGYQTVLHRKADGVHHSGDSVPGFVSYEEPTVRSSYMIQYQPPGDSNGTGFTAIGAGFFESATYSQPSPSKFMSTSDVNNITLFDKYLDYYHTVITEQVIYNRFLLTATISTASTANIANGLCSVGAATANFEINSISRDGTIGFREAAIDASGSKILDASGNETFELYKPKIDQKWFVSHNDMQTCKNCIIASYKMSRGVSGVTTSNGILANGKNIREVIPCAILADGTGTSLPANTNTAENSYNVGNIPDLLPSEMRSASTGLPTDEAILNGNTNIMRHPKITTVPSMNAVDEPNWTKAGGITSKAPITVKQFMQDIPNVYYYTQDSSGNKTVDASKNIINIKYGFSDLENFIFYQIFDSIHWSGALTKAIKQDTFDLLGVKNVKVADSSTINFLALSNSQGVNMQIGRYAALLAMEEIIPDVTVPVLSAPDGSNNYYLIGPGVSVDNFTIDSSTNKLKSSSPFVYQGLATDLTAAGLEYGVYDASTNILKFTKASNAKPSTYLTTKLTDYENFIMSWEWKARRGEDRAFPLGSGKYAGANSGIQFRSEVIGNNDILGFQVEMVDFPENTNNKTNCMLYEQSGVRTFPYFGYQNIDVCKTVFKTESWNTFVLKVNGPYIQTWCNGQIISDIKEQMMYYDEGYMRKSGCIALQWHTRAASLYNEIGSTLEVRNWLINKLPAGNWIPDGSDFDKTFY